MELDKARKLFREGNFICFTSDLDWASEAAIRDTLGLFAKNNLKPTIFLTHCSKAVDEMGDKIDVGIHPNFIQPSSQGAELHDVISYCKALAPDAKVFRCHRWYASNDIYDLLARERFQYESNLCTCMDIVAPFLHRSGMVSFPVCFEDGAYIIDHERLAFEDAKKLFQTNGLKVVNIHPMHYALNTPYFRYTREIKDRLSRQEWNGMSEEMLLSLRYQENGIRVFIEDLVQFVKEEKALVISLKEAYEVCQTGLYKF